MKRFHYSLQKILDLRHFQLKQAEMDLGKVNAQIAAVENKLKDIAAQRVRIAQEVDAAKDDTGLTVRHTRRASWRVRQYRVKDWKKIASCRCL